MLVMFFSMPNLRATSTDRPETLPHGQNLAEFYNPTPKIRGPPPKKWGPKTCLGLERLEIRRLHADLTMCFKIVHNLINAPFDQFLADRMGAYGIRCRLASDVVVVVCDDLYCGETVHPS